MSNTSPLSIGSISGKNVVVSQHADQITIGGAPAVFLELLGRVAEGNLQENDEQILERALIASGESPSTDAISRVVVQSAGQVNVTRFEGPSADRIAMAIRALNEKIRADTSKTVLQAYMQAVGRFAESIPYRPSATSGKERLGDVYVPVRAHSVGNNNGRNVSATLAEILRFGPDDSCVAIVGRSGSGKSTALRIIARACCSNYDLVGLPRPYLPFIVRCRSLVLAEGATSEERLLSALDIDRSLAMPGSRISEGFLDDWGSRLSCGWLFLLDGLDEVSDDQQLDLLQWIESFLETRPADRCLISGRTGTRSLMRHPITSRIELEPFDESQSRALASAWCGTRAEEFLSLTKKKGVSHILWSPLAGTIAAEIFLMTGTLPSSRVELFGEVLTSSLTSIRRRMASDPGPSNSSNALFGPMLEHLALISVEAATEITAASAVASAARFLRTHDSSLGPLVAEQVGSEMVGAITTHSGLVYGEKILQWSHLALRDFLAARALARCTNQEIAAKVGQLWTTSPDVVVFLFGLVNDQASATSVMKSFLESQAQLRLSEEELRQLNLLTSECLGERGTFGEELDDRIVKSIVRHAPQIAKQGLNLCESVFDSIWMVDAFLRLSSNPRQSGRIAALVEHAVKVAVSNQDECIHTLVLLVLMGHADRVKAMNADSSVAMLDVADAAKRIASGHPEIAVELASAVIARYLVENPKEARIEAQRRFDRWIELKGEIEAFPREKVDVGALMQLPLLTKLYVLASLDERVREFMLPNFIRGVGTKNWIARFRAEDMGKAGSWYDRSVPGLTSLGLQEAIKDPRLPEPIRWHMQKIVESRSTYLSWQAAALAEATKLNQVITADSQPDSALTSAAQVMLKCGKEEVVIGWACFADSGALWQSALGALTPDQLIRVVRVSVVSDERRLAACNNLIRQADQKWRRQGFELKKGILTAIIERGGDVQDTLRQRAHLNFDFEEYAEAICDFSSVIDVKPSPDDYMNRARSHFMADDEAAALTDLESAKAISDESDVGFRENYLVLKGKCLFFMKRYAESFRALNDAVSVLSGSPDSVAFRGMALANLGHFSEALADFEYARQKDVSAALFFGSELACVEALGRSEDVLNWVAAHKSLATKPYIQRTRFLAYMRLKDIDGMLAVSNEIKADHPESKEAALCDLLLKLTSSTSEVSISDPDAATFEEIDKACAWTILSALRPESVEPEGDSGGGAIWMATNARRFADYYKTPLWESLAHDASTRASQIPKPKILKPSSKTASKVQEIKSFRLPCSTICGERLILGFETEWMEAKSLLENYQHYAAVTISLLEDSDHVYVQANYRESARRTLKYGGENPVKMVCGFKRATKGGELVSIIEKMAPSLIVFKDNRVRKLFEDEEKYSRFSTLFHTHGSQLKAAVPDSGFVALLRKWRGLH